MIPEYLTGWNLSGENKVTDELRPYNHSAGFGCSAANGEVDKLRTEIRSLKLRYQELEEQTGKTGAERLRLLEETEEQARLLGISGSKEAKLLAEIRTMHERMVSSQPYYYKEWEASRELADELAEALDRIRTIDSPVFNGERVTTLNPRALSRWQTIAEEALKKHQELRGKDNQGSGEK